MHLLLIIGGKKQASHTVNQFSNQNVLSEGKVFLRSP